ncbi:cupin domain-containing protein [Pelagibius sp. Alg239-R121]|uniref:cupin domain-containing protein n=1 Tax=Pelagibius sp. Alg239-R121 TaxID=2993448 RepID=UPI0024A7591D|nr:cupin domain-containing protein [Pelagibius sp. Alg239-R121]
MPYDPGTINLADKFGKFSERWSPKIIGQLNNLHIKIAKIQGEFTWHSHEDTDELFMVHKGRLTIRYRDGEATLGPGDIHVVPKGVEHLPVAEEECEIIMIEPAGTLNTGDASDERTVEDPPWI